MIKTVIMNISGRCNQHCIFCLEGERGEQRKPDPTLRQVTAQLRGLRRQGAGHITFMGSETLFRKDLPEILTRAKRMGFTRLALATNGTALARRGYLGELADCGLEMVEFSLHGHSPELANMIAGTEFTYARQAKALAELDRNGRVAVIFNVVVCADNNDHLQEIVDYVHGNFPKIPARFKFKFVSLQGRELSRVASGGALFKYGMVDTAGLGAYMARLGIPFWFHNFPLCRLGRHAPHSEELQNIATGEQYFDLSREDGRYVPAGRMLGSKVWPVESCGMCSLRPLCPGVEAAYLSLRGGSKEFICSRKDPARLLCAASRDAGRAFSSDTAGRLLTRLKKETLLSRLEQPSGMYPAVFTFSHAEEMRSLDLKVVFRQKGTSARNRVVGGRYEIILGSGGGTPGNPRAAALKKAAAGAVRTATARRFSPGEAREGLLAAAGAAGWHIGGEISRMMIFLHPVAPRSLDVQVAVSRQAAGRGTGWSRLYVPEFRNKCFLPGNPLMEGFLSAAKSALKKAAEGGLDMEGACRMLADSAGAVGWRIMN